MRFLHQILWILSSVPRRIARLVVDLRIIPIDQPRFAPIMFRATLSLFSVSLGLTLVLIVWVADAFLSGTPLLSPLFQWICYAAVVFLVFRIGLEASLVVVRAMMTKEAYRAYRELLEEDDV